MNLLSTFSPLHSTHDACSMYEYDECMISYDDEQPVKN